MADLRTGEPASRRAGRDARSRVPQALRVVLLRALQAVAVMHAVLLVAQPFLAGSLLDGTYGALDMHADVGGMVLFAAMVLVPLAALLGWLQRSLSEFGAALAFFLVEALQVHAGQSGTLAVHVPLGVTLLGTGAAYAVWVLRRPA